MTPKSLSEAYKGMTWMNIAVRVDGKLHFPCTDDAHLELDSNEDPIIVIGEYEPMLMICYKDMTFCTQSTCKHFNTGCVRALTDAVRRDADEWWGKGENQAPIAQWTDAPACFEEEAQPLTFIQK